MRRDKDDKLGCDEGDVEKSDGVCGVEGLSDMSSPAVHSKGCSAQKVFDQVEQKRTRKNAANRLNRKEKWKEKQATE